MKKLFYILLLITGITNAQIVNIPDANFKAKLLSASPSNTVAVNLTGNYSKIDLNSNGEIESTEANQIKKFIGVQLQAAGYYPSLTLLELLRLFAGLYNVKVDAHEMLRLVGLEDKSKAKYKELSGGQKQRFSICTTLINRPKIVFLDEPTTGLDPQARRNLWDLIREIREKGTTVVITTHYMDEAENLCDRVAIIEKGKIIALDTPDKLIDNLVAQGFERKREVKKANLEDVFLNLTGHEWRDE